MANDDTYTREAGYFSGLSAARLNVSLHRWWSKDEQGRFTAPSEAYGKGYADAWKKAHGSLPEELAHYA